MVSSFDNSTAATARSIVEGASYLQTAALLLPISHCDIFYWTSALLLDDPPHLGSKGVTLVTIVMSYFNNRVLIRTRFGKRVLIRTRLRETRSN